MRYYLEKACEEIDAIIFSGDAMDEESVKEEFKVYLGRWIRELGFLEVDFSQRNKPPLGLVPKDIYINTRVNAILEAIERYKVAGKDVPKEWLEELSELVTGLEVNK